MAQLPANLNEFYEETRVASPSNFLMKIERFSLLSKLFIGSYVTRAFTWKLMINFEDTLNKNEKNYVSVYFSIADTDSLPAGWEVNAIFAFFIHNQIKDNFVCFRGPTRRFNAVIPRCGLSKLISKETLMDPTNGYVVDDSCVFGAEVLVIKSERVNECLSLVKDTPTIKREWKISDFSKLGEVWGSEEFDVGNYKWKVELYPKGVPSLPKNRYMSLFVVPKGIPPHQRVKAEVLMSIKTKLGESHRSKTLTHWFTSSCPDWGFREFVSIAEMNAEGFLADDCCFVEIEITLQAVVLEAPEI